MSLVKLKFLPSFVVTFLSLVFCDQAVSAPYAANGLINNVRVLDTQLGPDLNWISIAGFTSAGSCPLAGGVLTLMMRDDARGKEMLRMATAARLANQTVSVAIDDTYKTAAGYCLIQYLTILQ